MTSVAYLIATLTAVPLIANAQPGAASLVLLPNVFPINMTVDPRLADTVREMLLTSKSFRQRSEEIRALRHVLIRITFDGAITPPRGARAETVLRRYEYGLVRAHVRLWNRDNLPELIAHELEHVLEFTEGFQHRAEAILPTPAAWIGNGGAPETRRAIEMGERVAREVASARTARRQ